MALNQNDDPNFEHRLLLAFALVALLFLVVWPFVNRKTALPPLPAASRQAAPGAAATGAAATPPATPAATAPAQPAPAAPAARKPAPAPAQIPAIAASSPR